MKILFLGTGSSKGVPVPSCRCKVCKSGNSFNNRLRSSVVVFINGKTILIDPGQDLRQQLITHNIESVDAILITHSHFDHIGGIYDLRSICENNPGYNIPVFLNSHTIDTIKEHAPLIFVYLDLNLLSLDFNILDDSGSMDLFGIEVDFFTGDHNLCRSTAFIFDKKIIYLTDMQDVPVECNHYLKGLPKAILGANSWYSGEGSSHLGIPKCLKLCQEMDIKNLWLTHLNDNVDYDQQNQLPSWAKFAYDGLLLDV